MNEPNEQRRKDDVLLILKALQYLLWREEGFKSVPSLYSAIEQRVRELEQKPR